MERKWRENGEKMERKWREKGKESEEKELRARSLDAERPQVQGLVHDVVEGILASDKIFQRGRCQCPRPPPVLSHRLLLLSFHIFPHPR